MLSASRKEWDQAKKEPGRRRPGWRWSLRQSNGADRRQAAPSKQARQRTEEMTPYRLPIRNRKTGESFAVEDANGYFSSTNALNFQHFFLEQSAYDAVPSTSEGMRHVSQNVGPLAERGRM